MSWIVNSFIDKEDNEDKARVEFEICKEEDNQEILVDRFVHVVDANN